MPVEGTPGAARSEFTFGRFKNGLFPFRGGATPELKGIIGTVMDAFLSAHATPAFPTEEEQARIDAGEFVPGAELALDDRTGAQKRADILMGVFGAAARDPKSPRMGGAAPTVLVHVDAADLIDSTGVGWIDGVDAPISIDTVDRMVCAGGYQIVLGPKGEVLHLARRNASSLRRCGRPSPPATADARSPAATAHRAGRRCTMSFLADRT